MNEVCWRPASSFWFWPLRPFGMLWRLKPLKWSRSEFDQIASSFDELLSELAVERGAQQRDSSVNFSDKDLADLGHQLWLLQKRLQELEPSRLVRGSGVDDELPPKAMKRIERQIKRANASIATLRDVACSVGLEVIDPTGHRYEIGWSAVEIVEWQDVPTPRAHRGEYVHEALSPIIQLNGRLLSPARVICAKEESS